MKELARQLLIGIDTYNIKASAEEITEWSNESISLEVLDTVRSAYIQAHSRLAQTKDMSEVLYAQGYIRALSTILELVELKED